MALDRIFVKVPDIQYAVDYYPQILASLRKRGRVTAPELTNEDPRDPFMQAEQAFAYVGHLNNTLLDMVANSLFLKTSTIPEMVKVLLQLINYDLMPAGPARVDMVAELTSRYAAPQRIIESYRKFATKRSSRNPEIIFENPNAYDLTLRNDSQGVGYAYGMVYESQSTNGVLSSLESDILYDSTAPFTSADLNKYITIRFSQLGNDTEELRIVELLDQVGSNYRKVRLQNASFITDISFVYYVYSISSSVASNWNTGIAGDPIGGSWSLGEKIYFGHPDVMFDQIDMTLSAAVTPGYVGVWEFYDPSDTTINPDDVTVGAGTITFELTTLLGSSTKVGTLVEVTHVPSGAKYRGYTTYSGTNDLIVYTYMGQVPTPSTNESDYVVKSFWKELDIISDTTISGSSSWAVDGRITYNIPQSQDDSWYKYNLYDQTDGEDKLAFFIRFRIVTLAGGNAPIPNRVRIDQGTQKIVLGLVQGKTVEDNPLASSDGTADQEFILEQKPYVLASARIFVDEGGGFVEWTVLTSLVRSRATDKHCMVDPLPDGTAKILFGDGTNGKIPSIGTNNIRAVYRVGADVNGNIGADTLSVNRDGVSVFTSVTNPRQGRYWVPADWSSRVALEKAKERGPNLLSTMRRCVSPSDAEILALAFRTRLGVRPIARAKAVEEMFGPKTIGLIVCGGGGAALTSDETEEVEEYFNGGTVYGYPGITLANHRVYLVNYSPKLISLNVNVQAYSVITENLILELLGYVVSPVAVESNGKTYMWRFGQTVPLSKIQSEVFNLSPGNIFDVDVTSPTTDIALSFRELPLFDATSTNIVITDPPF